MERRRVEGKPVQSKAETEVTQGLTVSVTEALKNGRRSPTSLCVGCWLLEARFKQKDGARKAFAPLPVSGSRGHDGGRGEQMGRYRPSARVCKEGQGEHRQCGASKRGDLTLAFLTCWQALAAGHNKPEVRLTL